MQRPQPIMNYQPEHDDDTGMGRGAVEERVLRPVVKSTS